MQLIVPNNGFTGHLKRDDFQNERGYYVCPGDTIGACETSGQNVGYYLPEFTKQETFYFKA